MSQPDFGSQIKALAEELIRQNPNISLSTLNRIIAERTEAYNNTPHSDMAGLSPTQMTKLLYSDWNGPDSPIQIIRDLTLEELSGSLILANARLLLAAVRDRGGVKATVKGNLNRAFVLEMARSMRLDKTWDLHLDFVHKEEDLLELNALRHLLQIAGLLRKTKGYFYVTRKGAILTQDDQAGELQALLFETLFCKLNLAFLSGYLPECPPLQHTITFSFYAVSALCKDWQVEEDIYERLVLSTIRDMVEPRQYSDPLKSMVYCWILRPLEWLGLAEIEESRWEGGREIAPTRVRKTPLLDRFLQFQLETEPAKKPMKIRVHRHR